MAVDFEGSSEKIGEKNYYVLCLYGPLINNQKAIVILTGIQIYFDILVPDKEIINDGARKKVLQTVQDNNFETASDDMFSFHHKITRENGIAISETQSRELDEFAEIHDEESIVFIIFVYRNQTNLLKAFTLCWKAFIPDIQLGFSNSEYDWPFIIKRACKLNLLEWIWKQISGNFKSSEEIQKWNYYGKVGTKSKNSFQIKKGAIDNSEEENDRVQSIIIKISPEDNYIFTFLKILSCVPIDIRTCFMKLYPHAEVDKKSSLAFYLKICGLGVKRICHIIKCGKFTQKRKRVFP
ncbi:hypothetical protein Glove_117g250 [Diversispora epigaea]|uniref:DNA-directed DNA polymerase family B exonuclease domain-containing protein n=1 Tax=Diversispora epigaea TaxID=1348612 RepID=A0A397J4K4_9GLOM|nr:hypothetical protein Glove_117g250 [Diversispora epigaea]